LKFLGGLADICEELFPCIFCAPPFRTIAELFRGWGAVGARKWVKSAFSSNELHSVINSFVTSQGRKYIIIKDSDCVTHLLLHKAENTPPVVHGGKNTITLTKWGSYLELDCDECHSFLRPHC
jgi:hypothetical protein